MNYTRTQGRCQEKKVRNTIKIAGCIWRSNPLTICFVCLRRIRAWNVVREHRTSFQPRAEMDGSLEKVRLRQKVGWLRAVFAKSLASNSLDYRQKDFERRALSGLAIDYEPAAMILDNPTANRQAQSHAGFFSRGEKWLKDFGQILGADAKAGIGYCNDHFLRYSGGALGHFAADRQAAAIRHGVNGVKIEID